MLEELSCYATRTPTLDSNDSDSNARSSIRQGSGSYDEEDGFDDSFDDAGFSSSSKETDMLFGVQPEQIAMSRSNQCLIMLGQRRLSDSTQITRMASERVPDIPTPAIALYDQSGLH
jgi:hypothetical protein